MALSAVAREGSFRRAAERLGYVQSAVSGQISHLERAAGVRLLDRASGTPVVELTDAGRLLLGHVDEILARLDTARADLDSLPDRTAGAVRVAGLEHFSAARIARILSLFRRRHPLARFSLAEVETDAAGLEKLCIGELDLVICASVPATPSVTQIVLEDDEYVLLTRADSPLASRCAPPAAAEIAALHPIVATASSVETGLRSQLSQLGIEPSRFAQPDSVATAQTLVAAGLGHAIVPARLIDQRDPDTVVVDLSHLLAAHAIVLAVGERRGAAVQGFIAALREACDADPAGTEAAVDESSARPAPRAVANRARAA